MKRKQMQKKNTKNTDPRKHTKNTQKYLGTVTTAPMTNINKLFIKCYTTSYSSISSMLPINDSGDRSNQVRWGNIVTTLHYTSSWCTVTLTKQHYANKTDKHHVNNKHQQNNISSTYKRMSQLCHNRTNDQH